MDKKSDCEETAADCEETTPQDVLPLAASATAVYGQEAATTTSTIKDIFRAMGIPEPPPLENHNLLPRCQQSNSHQPGAIAVAGMPCGGGERPVSKKCHLTVQPRDESADVEVALGATLVRDSEEDKDTSDNKDAFEEPEMRVEIPRKKSHRRPKKYPPPAPSASSSNDSSQSRAIVLSSLIAAIAIIIVVVTTSLYMVQKQSRTWPQMSFGANQDIHNSDNATTTNLAAAEEEALPTTLPTISYPPFADDLNPLILKAIEEDPSSPQSQANRWMWKDPYLQNYNATRKHQRFALAVKYYATGGDAWTNSTHWLSFDRHECDWYSMTECHANGNILAQNLSSNHLVGSLTRGCRIASLLRADHSNNHITGTFPVMRGGSLIREYILSHNDLYGPLLGNAGLGPLHLRVLKLDSNRFQGEPHSAFQLLPELQVLNFTHNLFSGTVPAELAYLTKLTYLGLGHNRFTSSMPTEIGILTDLQHVDLSHNVGVTGTLPSELSRLEGLTYLDISETQLQGPIPETICEKVRNGNLTLVANCRLVECCS